MNKRFMHIPVRIHPLFWIVVCSAVWTGYFIEIFTLIVLVVIHELGHLAAANAFGWRMESIRLLPFGGVVKTDEWGTVPAREEITVALAGPFQHVFIVLISLFFHQQGWWSLDWTKYFIHGNMMVAGFNLLPIYPLDGGRILQSSLSYFFPYRVCLEITLWLGMAGSLLLCVCSFFLSSKGVVLHLLLLGLFLFHSNYQTFKQKNIHFVRFLLYRRYHPDRSHRVTKLRVRADARLNTVMRKICKEKYHILEVHDETGKLISVVPEEWALDTYLRSPYYRKEIREWFAS
ncbi:M50 family metallopeptidase [Thermoactinomyces mirandus]|uniref:M50 family metallopeptidase n=1 Tax=Thermoactinomyces mirandus TaxID=2756294 RepID=A0A7W2ARL5_9BACL|nr:M50 family metallopeptidase [Thermoactinomyces mirandus]MBA4602723.1 M50 family metallopeptidase [Thermoactinomyces mirandus]